MTGGARIVQTADAGGRAPVTSAATISPTAGDSAGATFVSSYLRPTEEPIESGPGEETTR